MDGADKRMLEREALRNMIQQWNANRLDLFELSEPNENLEFHGVMRFYFQDSGQKIATKCIRVASDATVSDVIETLIEKFRPDMRMLSLGSYSLWETHGPDDERKLEPHEKPLLVQLNWHADDREGRFLLKCTTGNETQLSSINEKGDQNFKRKLSKREKKELKKKEKLSRLKSDANDENRPVAEKLYTELPETSFTRSISNPEAVMRRRRQQKLERKLQQFRSKDGGPDTGGTLKIYGSSLCPHVPYKTLLLSIRDAAAGVVREVLDKYGPPRREPQHYCLVQVDTTDNSEYILEDDECPLAIVMTHPHSSSIMFHVRRRPADSQPRRRKKKVGGGSSSNGPSGLEPILVETEPDGTPLENGRRVRVNDIVEVGSSNGTALQLYGPSIQPRHCVIAPAEGGGYSVTPLHTDAQVLVNGRRALYSQPIQHGSLLKFGRVSTFRFVDPAQETLLNRNLSQSQHFGSGSIYDRLSSSVGGARPGQEAILPAVLEFPEAGQAQLLAAVISRLDPHAPAFKLAPVYTLYLCARYRASTHYRPELTPTERAHKLTAFLHHVATLIHATVQERCTDSAAQAFWMANASELLHFLKCDRHISSFSTQAQELLPTTVQNAFSNLVSCFQEELSRAIATLSNPLVSDGTEATAPTLQALAAAMVLLRRCRVNAALTIQLFSHLFHYINAVLFNKLVQEPSTISGRWGQSLSARLALLAAWAERQGLELAADCHLARTHQAARLIQGEYTSEEQVRTALSSCFKLNSVQVRALLTPLLAPPLLDAAVAHARSLADELATADGREITLEESTWLGVGLLIPGDGFSAEVVRGVPPGLAEFIAPLQRGGLCRLAHQGHAVGLWTVYMAGYGHHQRRAPDPRVRIIQLNKNSNGMGLSIVAAKGAGQSKLGIYIKSVVPGGAAAADGRLAAGDQLLSVDGHSLQGISQEKAAEYLVRTGPTVTLEVAKQGAVLHGLATLLHQPTYNQKQGVGGASGALRRASERDLPSRLAAEAVKASRSTPALHHDDTPATRHPTSANATAAEAWSNKSLSSHNLASGGQQDGFYQNLPTPPHHSSHHQSLNDRWSTLRSSGGARPQSTLLTTPDAPAPLHQPTHSSQMNIRAAKLSEMSEEASRRQPQMQYQQKPSPILPHHHPMSPTHMHSTQYPQHVPNLSANISQMSMQSPLQQNVHSTMSQSQQNLQSQMSQMPPTMQSPMQPTMQASMQSVQSTISSSHQNLAHVQQNIQAMSSMATSQSNMSSVQPQSQLGSQQALHMQHMQQQQIYHNQHQPPQRYEWHPSGPPSPQRQQPPVAPKPQQTTRRPEIEDQQLQQKQLQQQQLQHQQIQQQQLQQQQLQQQQLQQQQMQQQQIQQQQLQQQQIQQQQMQQQQIQQQQIQQQQMQQQMQQQQTQRQQMQQEQQSTSQQNQLGSTVQPEEERYVASALEPPSVGVYPANAGGRSSDRPSDRVHNPWQREERERQLEARRAVGRARRDATITHLVSLGASRTTVQSQQLRALQLERDFERRATRPDPEDAPAGEEDVSEEERHSPSPPPPAAPAPPKSILKVNRTELPNGHPPQAIKNPEDVSVPALSSSLSQLRMSPSGGGSPPPPPERGSSFAVMATRVRAPEPAPDTLQPHQSPPAGSRDKRVSFHAAPPPPPASSPPPLNPPASPQDPNRFLLEAESVLGGASPPAATHTPGVIGAQEVYKDPRARRLAAAQQQAAAAARPVPEALSFREKMRMFALEAGDPNTPKEKVKISRAQRDIDAVH